MTTSSRSDRQPPNHVKCCRPLRGLALSLILTWGSAALHPRLYATARYRGLALGIHPLEIFSHLNLDCSCKALRIDETAPHHRGPAVESLPVFACVGARKLPDSPVPFSGCISSARDGASVRTATWFASSVLPVAG